MTFEEFIALKNVELKDSDHKRIVNLIYPYLQSVSGNKDLLLSLLGELLNVDFKNVFVVTACFNGVNDATTPPYGVVDCYIKLSSDVKIFVYGREVEERIKLKENEWVIFICGNKISNNIFRTEDRHIFVK